MANQSWVDFTPSSQHDLYSAPVKHQQHACLLVGSTGDSLALTARVPTHRRAGSARMSPAIWIAERILSLIQTITVATAVTDIIRHIALGRVAPEVHSSC